MIKYFEFDCPKCSTRSKLEFIETGVVCEFCKGETKSSDLTGFYEITRIYKEDIKNLPYVVMKPIQ